MINQPITNNHDADLAERLRQTSAGHKAPERKPLSSISFKIGCRKILRIGAGRLGIVRHGDDRLDVVLGHVRHARRKFHERFDKLRRESRCRWSRNSGTARCLLVSASSLAILIAAI